MKKGNKNKIIAKFEEIDYNLPPYSGQIAQSVEQKTENLCVGGSIPPLATSNVKDL